MWDGSLASSRGAVRHWQPAKCAAALSPRRRGAVLPAHRGGGWRGRVRSLAGWLAARARTAAVRPESMRPAAGSRRWVPVPVPLTTRMGGIRPESPAPACCAGPSRTRLCAATRSRTVGLAARLPVAPLPLPASGRRVRVPAPPTAPRPRAGEFSGRVDARTVTYQPERPRRTVEAERFLVDQRAASSLSGQGRAPVAHG
jgi:hypothetical protein